MVLITRFSRSEEEKNMLFWQFVTVGAVNFLFGLGERWHLNLEAISVGIYSGVFATTLGILWQMRYQKEVGNNTTALVYMTQPFVSLVLSFLLLGERMSFLQLLGGILVLVALFTGTMMKPRESN
ncbi:MULTISPECIES: DMT family transporter [unclassified Thermotoga]|uniref:DMT family transporter n=1 Tax=Thermotoga sp. Xyl54 TaxID=1235863 RepID=UPI000AD350D8|nr:MULTISPECIES: DMT family transporter [unclassified Thermotoga]